MPREKETGVGIIGTGFIAKGLSYSLRRDPSLEVSRVLTRRKSEQVRDLAVENRRITNSVQELIDTSSVVVECSGDPVYATKILTEVMEAGIPVVTMDSELQITTGSWLAKKGLITEAEGDQPGCLAALYLEMIAMGFYPMVLGNIKGFLNNTPAREEMEFWAQKSGISLEQVTAFTDGTKIQIEQTLVANGLGATIAQRGLLGIQVENHTDGAKLLAERANTLGQMISDYVLSPKSPAGVFIAAKHDDIQASYLRYYKLGEGPYYVLTRPFHVCHLEIPKTIKHVLRGDGVLLNNGLHPEISVATIAKRSFVQGETIKRGIGSFDVRGEAIRKCDYPNHLPIGLVSDVVLRRPVEIGELLTFADIDIPDSLALSAWKEMEK